MPAPLTTTIAVNVTPVTLQVTFPNSIFVGSLLSAGGVVYVNTGGVITSTGAMLTGQTIMGSTGGNPFATSSPSFGGNVSVTGTSTLTGNVTVGVISGSSVNNSLVINGSSVSGYGPYIGIGDNTGGVLNLGSSNVLVGGSSRNGTLQSAQGIVFYTNNSSLALTLDASQNATFAKSVTVYDAFLHRTLTTLTNNAASSSPTLGAAGPAGATTPTKWASVNDNGTTRYVPMW